MNSNIKLSFYTNIPTPYQDDFFNALSRICDFNAVFYAKTESDRNWPLDNVGYKRVFLNSNIISKFIQKWFKDFHFSWEIFNVCWKENSEWIILGGNYFALNNLFASIILKFKKKKVAFYTEQLKSDSRLWLFLKKIYLNVFFSNVDLIICVGNCACNSYKKLGFLNKDKISIPYNIEIEKFFFENLNLGIIQKIKTELNLQNKIVFLSSGALIHRKGMDLAIQAFQSLEDKHSGQASLIILGEGSQKEFLSKLRHSDDIHFIGFKQKNEIPYYFAIADVFLFCSRYDGWGLVVNEAIAAGSALICSDAVGASEWIDNGMNGFIVENENLSSYVLAMDTLISQPQLRDKFKKENAIRREYTSSTYYANYLIDNLISRKR